MLPDGAKVVVVRFEAAKARKTVFTAEHGMRRFSVCRD